jgi:L,D-transpeptidase catalytic domain
MGVVASRRAASERRNRAVNRSLGARANRIRDLGWRASLLGAGLLTISIAAPAEAWHERWSGYSGYYYTPYAPRYQAPAPKRPRVERDKPLRSSDPKRAPLPEIAKGQLQIVISVGAQRARIYSDGVAVAETPVSTGTASHPTPHGIFNVIQKNRHHRSNLYSDAPMPYMQRLTWSGIALHEGRLPGYPASHGCIRLPQSFAYELWRTTRIGARVIIDQDEPAPLAIAHARLAALLPKPAEDVSPKQPDAMSSSSPVKVAAAAVVDAGAEAPAASPDPAMAEGTGAGAKKAPAFKPGPVSLFVSRREGKLYVRKGFEPIYTAPVTIRDKDKPLGTHLFTALAEGESLRWTVISLSDAPRLTDRIMEEPRSRRRERQRAIETPKPTTARAAAALERIELPPEALAFVSGLMSPGASLIISDLGLGHETGLGTDFIVVTQQ